LSKWLIEQGQNDSKTSEFLGSEVLFSSHLPGAFEGGPMGDGSSFEGLYTAVWMGLAKGEMGPFVTV
jgi:hypothetical protein